MAPWHKRTGETPREFLLRLHSAAKEDLSLSAALEELIPDVDQAFYAKKGSGQSFPQSKLVRRRVGASARRQFLRDALARLPVFQQQKAACEYLKKYGGQIGAWGPFAEGRRDMFTNPVLTEIGAKYDKTAAQTALRFLMQSGVVIIPKSTHKDRMQQNFDLFDFTLTGEDMARIEALDGGESLFFSHYDPKTVEWFMSIL